MLPPSPIRLSENTLGEAAPRVTATRSIGGAAGEAEGFLDNLSDYAGLGGFLLRRKGLQNGL